MASPVSAGAAGPAVRFVLQRVRKASLVVDNLEERVHIGRGVVAYVSFFAGATDAHVPKAVKALLEARFYQPVAPDDHLPPALRGGSAAAAAAAAAPSSTEESPTVASPPAAAAAARVKPVSFSEDPQCSLMLVPQASLVGRVKGRAVQYHGACAKDDGLNLYTALVAALQRAVPNTAERTFVSGTYGNWQSMEIDATVGPMCHVLDVDL
jgi:D-Tyr-tRNAtyr deacylase